MSIFLTTLVMGLYQNCGQARFSNYNNASGNNNGNGGQTCTETLIETQKNIRIIFMVDNSTSTNTTDPSKYYRIQTVNQFLQKYESKQNFSYAYGLFSGTTGTFYDINQNIFKTGVTNPFGGASLLGSALNKFSTMSAQSATPYKGAFTAIQSAITNSLSNGNNPKDFVVVFMSDGQPTDLPNPQQPQIIQLVNDLRTATQSLGGAVNVSSVYFGPAADATSINNMQSMAQAGLGQFVNTNQSGQLIIDDLIVIPGESCL